MKRLLGVLAAVALIFGITACGGSAPSKGYVQFKYYQPEHEQLIPIVMSTYCGNGCTYVWTVLIPYDVSQSWNVVLKDCNGSKCHTGTRSVSVETYTGLRVGQYVDLSKKVVAVAKQRVSS